MVSRTSQTYENMLIINIIIIGQVIMSIAMALLLGIFIIFPLKERVTNAKQVKTSSSFSSSFSCFLLLVLLLFSVILSIGIVTAIYCRSN